MAEGENDFDGGTTFIEEPVSLEDRARAMGWKPKDEYRGDARRWTDAEEFIAHGEAELPILRDQSRRMSEKLARAEGQIGSLTNTVAEQRRAIDDAIALARRADDRGYQRGLDELKAKQREAASVGDMDAFDQTNALIEAAERERATVDVVIPPLQIAPVSPPQPDPETQTFMNDNPWFNDKPILKRAMIDAHTAIVQKEGVATGQRLADQFERAKAEVVDAFPQYFPKARVDDDDDEQPRQRPRLRVAGTLEPSGVVPMQRRGGTPFDRIEDPSDRKEAKDAYERLVKLGSTDMSPDEYVSLYIDPHMDTLTMRANRKKA